MNKWHYRKNWKKKNGNFHKKGKKGGSIRICFLGLAACMVIVCLQNLQGLGDFPAWQEVWGQLDSRFYSKTVQHCMPVLAAGAGGIEMQPSFCDYFMELLKEQQPVLRYLAERQEYETQVESDLSYEILLAREGVDEQYRDGVPVEMAEPEIPPAEDNQAVSAEVQEQPQEPVEAVIGQADSFGFASATEQLVQINREKLNDFDYLIQNFYTVDKTTTIDSSLLNAAELLAMDMKLITPSDQPQILIHHTHSQEGFVGSTGDSSTSIVGVGDYLTQILTEKYGFNVIHDRNEYDVIDHDNAYAYAGPAIEKYLEEYPSIEVVIDLHRDGIGSGRLVTEVNGKPTAKIMFFNGLSRTTANGDLNNLSNPYIKENLSLSLQMKLVAEEYYPGLARNNYIKGYRYNMHYRPKSMLIEVGAQTNTVEEAMNAMEPLSDLLNKVLGGSAT